MSSFKCCECEVELKTHAKICLECLDEIKNDKYNDFALVMASVNNALHTLMKEKEELQKEVVTLKEKCNILNVTNITKVET